MHTPLNEYWNDPETKALKEGRFPNLRLRKMDGFPALGFEAEIDAKASK